jgi:hypothetical protein
VESTFHVTNPTRQATGSTTGWPNGIRKNTALVTMKLGDDFLECEMPVTLTTEEFALLHRYLAREHSIDWDPASIGLTTKIGKKLWDRIQQIGVEQGFAPSVVTVSESDLDRLHLALLCFAYAEPSLDSLRCAQLAARSLIEE